MRLDIALFCLYAAEHMDNEAFQTGTPLFRAITTGNEECLKNLLSAGADANECYGEDEEPALLVAAVEGREEMALQLLAAGAEVNAAENNEGNTVLMCAVQALAPELVELLLAHGAKAALRSSRGDTAAEYISNELLYLWNPIKRNRANRILEMLKA